LGRERIHIVALEPSYLTENSQSSIATQVFVVVVVVVFVVVIVVVFKIYLFYVYEYTVSVFRHTRRGHLIPLQMVVSHHVTAGI